MKGKGQEQGGIPRFRSKSPGQGPGEGTPTEDRPPKQGYAAPSVLRGVEQGEDGETPGFTVSVVRWMEKAVFMVWPGQELAEETQAEATGAEGGGEQRTWGFKGMVRLSGDSSVRAVGELGTLQSSKEEVSGQGEPEEAGRVKG